MYINYYVLFLCRSIISYYIPEKNLEILIGLVFSFSKYCSRPTFIWKVQKCIFWYIF